MGQEPVYVTREQVIDALDIKPTAYMYNEVDRACRSASRAVEGKLHRIFYPEVLTRAFDYPRAAFGSFLNRIYFDERALVTLTSTTSDGATIPPANVFLYPDGQPADWIEIDRDTSSTFSGGPQRAVKVTGLWGWRDDEDAAGVLTGSISSSDTFLSFDFSPDVGSVLRIENERVQVLGKRWLTSGQMGSITADKAASSLAVSDGSVFREGEIVLLDSERMRVQEIAGNTLIVQRAVGGTTLAAHTSAAIFRANRVQVERGSLGTTAAAHNSAVAVQRWVPPSLIAELAQAYAEDAFLQRSSGYARTVGSGDNERAAPGRGIADVERRAYAQYGRKARMRSV